MLYICHSSGILDSSSTEALNTSKIQNGRGKVIMFDVALSNIYHRFQTCTDLWSLAIRRLPFHQINLSFLSNYLHSYLFQFNKCFACFKLIKCHCFKQIKFFKIFVLNKVNIHKIERILKSISVLSRGWHDFQQVGHWFIFLVWWYLLSSDLCWGCSSNKVVVGVVPQYSRKQSVVEDFVFSSSNLP